MRVMFEKVNKQGNTVRFREIAFGQVEAMQRARDEGWKLISMRAA